MQSLDLGPKPLWGFRRNVFEAIKRFKVVLKNYIIGPRNYTSLWPACFSWLIFTSSCLRSWSTGVREWYLPLQYYNRAEMQTDKVRKNKCSKLHLKEEQACFFSFKISKSKKEKTGGKRSLRVVYWSFRTDFGTTRFPFRGCKDQTLVLLTKESRL